MRSLRRTALRGARKLAAEHRAQVQTMKRTGEADEEAIALAEKRAEGFLYDLTPIAGGLEIPAVRYAEFDPLPENVSLFPRRLPASVAFPDAPLRMPGESHPSPGALSNYGDV